MFTNNTNQKMVHESSSEQDLYSLLSLSDVFIFQDFFILNLRREEHR